jgi:putative transposase
MFAAIFYVLITGIQWKALPRSLGAPSTVHDRKLWTTGLIEFDASAGLDWRWQALDALP